MKTVGMIVEYNPFHNGHLYHITKTKEQSKCDLLIAVMSGHFTQRGDIAILDKFTRAEIALKHGVDIVIELPYFYATSSADLFSFGAINLLNHLKVDEIYFGSETNDIQKLTKIAQTINSDEFNQIMKTKMKAANSYASVSHQVIGELLGDETTLLSNDILGIQYIRSILKLNSSIKPYSIKRIHNHYLDEHFTHPTIASATSIRKAVKQREAFESYVPKDVSNQLKKPIHTWDDFYPYLKYQIHANPSQLADIHDINEGFDHAIIKEVNQHQDFKSFVQALTSKRYTESKVQRIMCHILTQFTKTEFTNVEKDYIRILGINKQKTDLWKRLTDQLSIPIITNINKYNIKYLQTEMRVDHIYTINSNNKVRKIPVFI